MGKLAICVSIVLASVYSSTIAFSQSAGPVDRVSHGRGAVPPADLVQRVARQNAIAQEAQALLRSLGPRRSRPACSPSLSHFDWRDTEEVSPIEDQKRCGSCWAFAAVAAYEASFMIENGRPVDLSEQEALDCAFQQYDCDGGWHDKVFDLLVSGGQVDVAKYPPGIYQASKGTCQNIMPRAYFADTWGFVRGANIPSDAELKAAICEHGPIVTAVSSEGWDVTTNWTGTETLTRIGRRS